MAAVAGRNILGRFLLRGASAPPGLSVGSLRGAVGPCRPSDLRWELSRSLRLAATLCDAMQIRMPSLSPTMTQGTIIKWHKKEGDPIAAGDVLCDIQTDKAVLGFEVDDDGVIAKILKPDNSTDVSIGTLIALIVGPGEDWKNVAVPADTAPAGAPAKAPAAAPAPAAPAPMAGAAAAHHGSALDAQSYGPAVRSILEMYTITISEVKASGPHGRVLKGDLLKLIKEKNLKPTPVKAAAPPAAAAAAGSAAVSAPAPTRAPAAASSGAEYVDIPLTTMRSVIAKRLTQSKTTIPHSYASIDCKMDSLMSLRKDMIATGVKVGVNDFIIKAAAVALKKVPEVNAIWAGDAPKLLTSIDISIAVATDSGLITPIVKDAFSISVEEISLRVKDLATRARAGKLKPEEFQGGSFTISNLGMFGITSFSAVINPPQACILAVGGSRVVPASDWSPSNKSNHTLLSVTTSSDARVVDDLVAVRFLTAFCEAIENPMTIMLGQQQGPAKQQPTSWLQKLFAK